MGMHFSNMRKILPLLHENGQKKRGRLLFYFSELMQQIIFL